MTNVAGVPAFGGGGFAFRQPPDPPEPAVPQIAEIALSDTATYTKGNELPGQNGDQLTYDLPQESVDQTDAAYLDSYDVADGQDVSLSEDLPEDILAGPTPAFQASVLEVELSLQHSLAELAAKRGHEEDAEFIAPASNTADSSDSHHDVVRSSETNQSQLRADQAEKQATQEVTSLSETQSNSVDPEAALAGPAAVQATPFDG